jgi:hypothetical protein
MLEYLKQLMADVKEDFEEAEGKIGKGKKATLSIWEIPVSSMSVFRAFYPLAFLLTAFAVLSLIFVGTIVSLADADQRKWLREDIKIALDQLKKRSQQCKTKKSTG